MIYDLLFTFNVFPDLLIPSPDIIWPAPENWVKLIEVVPKEILSVVQFFLTKMVDFKLAQKALEQYLAQHHMVEADL